MEKSANHLLEHLLQLRTSCLCQATLSKTQRKQSFARVMGRASKAKAAKAKSKPAEAPAPCPRDDSAWVRLRGLIEKLKVAGDWVDAGQTPTDIPGLIPLPVGWTGADTENLVCTKV